MINMSDKEFFAEEDARHFAINSVRRAGTWMFVGFDAQDADRNGYIYIPTAKELE